MPPFLSTTIAIGTVRAFPKMNLARERRVEAKSDLPRCKQVRSLDDAKHNFSDRAIKQRHKSRGKARTSIICRASENGMFSTCRDGRSAWRTVAYHLFVAQS